MSEPLTKKGENKQSGVVIGTGWAFGSLGLYIIISGFVGAFFVAGYKTLDLNIDQLLTINIVSSSLTLIVAWLVTRKKSWFKGKDFLDMAGLKSPKKSRSELAFAMGGSVAIYVAILIAANIVISVFDLNPAEQEISTNIRDGSAAPLVAFLAVVIVAPIFEEIINRGFIFRSLEKSISFWPAALISSLVFGFLHAPQTLAVIMTFCLGLILCWLTRYCGSIYPAIGLHMLNNLVVFAALLSL